MSAIDLPDDEWEDIEPGQSAKALPLIQARISMLGARNPSARGLIAFRGEAAEWVKSYGPRFRAQLGAAADLVRLISDATNGKHEFFESRGGTIRINLGRIAAWPNETRPPVACTFKIDGPRMIVSIPLVLIRPSKTNSAPPSPMSQVVAQQRAQPSRGVSSVSLGEPAAGRSALDQRNRQ